MKGLLSIMVLGLLLSACAIKSNSPNNSGTSYSLDSINMR